MSATRNASVTSMPVAPLQGQMQTVVNEEPGHPSAVQAERLAVFRQSAPMGTSEWVAEQTQNDV
jgi:hypothetical protein